MARKLYPLEIIVPHPHRLAPFFVDVEVHTPLMVWWTL